MDSGLFRQEAVDAQTTNSPGSIRLATPVSHQLWTLAALVRATGIVLWLCFVHYPARTRIRQPGTQAGLLTVTARSAGTVLQLHAPEGTRVRAGDALLTLSGERSSVAMGDTEAAVSAQQLQSSMADAQSLARGQAHDLGAQRDLLRQQIHQLDAQATIERRQESRQCGVAGTFELSPTPPFPLLALTKSVWRIRAVRSAKYHPLVGWRLV